MGLCCQAAKVKAVKNPYHAGQAEWFCCTPDIDSVLLMWLYASDVYKRLEGPLRSTVWTPHLVYVANYHYLYVTTSLGLLWRIMVIRQRPRSQSPPAVEDISADDQLVCEQADLQSAISRLEEVTSRLLRFEVDSEVPFTSTLVYRQPELGLTAALTLQAKLGQSGASVTSATSAGPTPLPSQPVVTAVPAPGGSAGSSADIAAYDQLLSEQLQPFLSAAAAVGGEVRKRTGHPQCVFWEAIKSAPSICCATLSTGGTGGALVQAALCADCAVGS